MTQQCPDSRAVEKGGRPPGEKKPKRRKRKLKPKKEFGGVRLKKGSPPTRTVGEKNLQRGRDKMQLHDEKDHNGLFLVKLKKKKVTISKTGILKMSEDSPPRDLNYMGN